MNETLKNFPNVFYCRMDSEHIPQFCLNLAKDINLFGVPTVVVLKDGKKTVLVGANEIKKRLPDLIK